MHPPRSQQLAPAHLRSTTFLQGRSTTPLLQLSSLSFPSRFPDTFNTPRIIRTRSNQDRLKSSELSSNIIMPSRGGRGGGAGRGPRAPQTREVTISKALSFVLRHGAQAERIHLDEGGWANVEDIVSLDSFDSLDLSPSKREREAAFGVSTRTSALIFFTMSRGLLRSTHSDYLHGIRLAIRSLSI